MLTLRSVLFSLLLMTMSFPTCFAESTRLRYDGGAQFTIETPAGRHIFIDVFSPAELEATPSDQDILLTTHRTHMDHWHREFKESFPGQQLFVESGELVHPDVRVVGIPSGHHPDDGFSEDDCSHAIFLIETGGVRIAHLGDIGQDTFTENQLQTLGRLDVLITQFVNPRYSLMDLKNKKGFRLVEQLNPRLVIPTHHTGLAAMELAKDYWPCLAFDSQTIKITAGALPPKTQFLVLGELASIAMEDLGYRLWTD